MLYTPLTMRAMRFCFDAHRGQVDKGGVPYANHPLHLAEHMQSEDETCVALLHDVMEDCGKTPDDLRAIGVSERAIEALLLLMHKKDVPYLAYVRNLMDDDIARKVKGADLRHNSELARLNEVGSGDLDRLRKYMEARVLLGDMTYRFEMPVGSVSVTVDGEPYPFAIEDETRGVQVVSPMVGDPREVWRMEVDTLALTPGAKIVLVCDFDGRVVDSGVNDGIPFTVYEKDGRVVERSFLVSEPGRCSYRLEPESGSFDIVDDPVAHRSYPRAHKFGVRFAWSWKQF